MTIYIPTINFAKPNRPSLFILTRPFYTESGWANDEAVKKRWLVSDNFKYTSTIEEADVFFIPNPINTYSKQDLSTFNTLCASQNIKGYGYISGDFGKHFQEFSHLTYFRMGGFKSQLSTNNQGFPVMISDYYKDNTILFREKQKQPVVGFCGHAQLSFWKSLKEQSVFIKENIKRFLNNPLRKDYEPLFSSAFQRAKLLQNFEQSKRVTTNFIYRKHYRAGATTPSERQKTTQEYFNNIKNSDYVLCVRGAGNFSVRLYETLMMGRIPVFVDTDCLLPLENSIAWKEHCVWVSWKDRHLIANKVNDFHDSLSKEAFKELQLKNRVLWKETLSLSSLLNFIKDSTQLRLNN